VIIAIDHAQITIPKNAETEAREFYCGLLKLREIPKPAALAGRGGFWLEVGDKQLHIGTEDDVDRVKTKAHVAYEVADLDECREILSDAGIPVHDGVQISGMRRFEFRDPFGNRIEFLERSNR